MVRRHGIPYHEKKLGQLFCNGSSREIVSMLERECRDRGVSLHTNVAVAHVSHGDGFEVAAETTTFRAPALVIATGGLSIPKIGATGFGYDIARQFGLRVRECRPALVPLAFAEDDLRKYGDMAGVSFDAGVSSEGAQFREKALITHRGLSGPAILQVSSYWRPGAAVSIDLAPEGNVFGPLLAGPKRDQSAARAVLRLAIADRLADRWMELNAPERWRNADVAELERRLHCWTVHPAGTEGYAKAEVTAGGVDTDELSAKTMESRKVRGLYFIGEVVDVTGHLGGFNFQWAWASGFCAGQAL
jgi:predicted Rossmann fold flavoprotein